MEVVVLGKIEWIKIEDFQPSDNGNVNLLPHLYENEYPDYKDAPFMGFYEKGKWFDEDADNELTSEDITHWAPLPKNPFE